MNVPTPTLRDIEGMKAPERNKLQDLLHERAVLGYRVSFKALVKAFAKYIDNEDELVSTIQGCICAFNDEEEKAVKDDLNKRLTTIYLDHDLKTLAETDPFGRKKLYLMFQSSTASRMDQSKALELAPKFDIPAKKLANLFTAATVPGKSYVTFQAKDVKDKVEE